MRFDYGDEVIFKEASPGGHWAERICCVVGITIVETEEQIQVFGHPTGTILYTVEFRDGSDQLVPEHALEPIPRDNA
jgi:hypothetical protein